MAYKYDKILLVDDNEIDNFVNHRMMEIVSFSRHIVLKQSEKEALAYLRNECQKDADYPDFVFISPGVSSDAGSNFTQEVKKLSSNPSKNKVIILSIFDDPDHLKMIEKRISVFKALSKPLTIEELNKI